MTLLFGAGTLVAPVMTIAVAELSYRLLERPVLRRGRARPEGRRRIAGRRARVIGDGTGGASGESREAADGRPRPPRRPHPVLIAVLAVLAVLPRSVIGDIAYPPPTPFPPSPGARWHPSRTPCASSSWATASPLVSRSMETTAGGCGWRSADGGAPGATRRGRQLGRSSRPGERARVRGQRPAHSIRSISPSSSRASTTWVTRRPTSGRSATRPPSSGWRTWASRSSSRHHRRTSRWCPRDSS